MTAVMDSQRPQQLALRVNINRLSANRLKHRERANMDKSLADTYLFTAVDRLCPAPLMGETAQLLQLSVCETRLAECDSGCVYMMYVFTPFTIRCEEDIK